MINYKEIDSSIIEEVKELYRKNSWNAYLKNDEKLIRAFNNSLYTEGVFDENKLIGIISINGSRFAY